MANNFCRQNRKIDVNTCNKTGDKSRRGYKQNIVVRHFELERLHLSLWRSWLQKYPANVHTNSANPNKKIHQRAVSKICGFGVRILWKGV